MADITCQACGSEDLRGERSGNRILLTCEACGHHFERVPTRPCKRCGSKEVTMSAYQGWAYDDLEEAAGDTNASWGYVDREVFRCRKCNFEWVESGPVRPYQHPGRAATPGEAPISTDELWARIRRHQGEVFSQIRGREFTYGTTEAGLFPDTTPVQIPRKHFEQALRLVPLENTVPVHHLFGPSYIFAVLMDRRIREGDW